MPCPEHAHAALLPPLTAAAEMTFKEMQLRMADPEVAGNATEFQRVARAAAELEETVNTFRDYLSTEGQLTDTQVGNVLLMTPACTALLATSRSVSSLALRSPHVVCDSTCSCSACWPSAAHSALQKPGRYLHRSTLT